MNKEIRTEIFTRLRDQNPNPTTELEWNTPFELLIAVLLSAQATDVSVNLATRKLYAIANTPAILALGIDGVKECIKTIGLYNSKAENVMKTCAILLETAQWRNTENARGVRSVTWCWAQNSKCGFKYCIWMNQPWRLTRIFFDSQTEHASRPAKMS